MAVATPARVGRRAGFTETTYARKFAMALSGAIFVGYVILHFLGNLKVFQGPEAFNHYAEGLRTLGAPFFARGQLLWIARIILLVSLVFHVGAALELTVRSRRARPVKYQKFEPLVFHQASRTMFWGGLAILAFVIYHLLHLTFGSAHPDFIHGDAYHNFVRGFQVWPASVVYIAAMIPLGLHLYHGVWSALQTIGVSRPDGDRWRRPLAMAIAVIVAGGNALFPIAVLAGILR